MEEFSKFTMPDTAEKDANDWMNPDNLLEHLKATSKSDWREADRALVDSSYRVAAWHYRRAALSGDWKLTRSLQIWIAWAEGVLARPRSNADSNVNPEGSRNFGTR